MKTLDQIWEENFDTVAPGEYTGSDCGNQVGGGNEPNSSPPAETLDDKINAAKKENENILSPQAMQNMISKITNDHNKTARGQVPNSPTPPEGLSKTNPDRNFNNLTEQGKRHAARPQDRGEGNSDSNSGPLSPRRGSERGISDSEAASMGMGNPYPASKIDLGGLKMRIPFGTGADGEDPFGPPEFSPIDPDPKEAIKKGLENVVGAVKAACSSNKSEDGSGGNGSGAAAAGDAVTPTPTATTGLLNKSKDQLTPSFNGRLPVPPRTGGPASTVTQRPGA